MGAMTIAQATARTLEAGCLLEVGRAVREIFRQIVATVRG